MKEYRCWRADKEGRLYGSIVVAVDDAKQAAGHAYMNDYEVDRLYAVDRYLVYAYDSATGEDGEHIEDVMLLSM